MVDVAAEDDSGGTTLLVHVTKQKSFSKPSDGSNTSPSDICKVLSTNIRNDGSKPTPSEFYVNGKIYRLVDNECVVYQVTASPNQGASLIDRGANDGIAGVDVCIISKTLQYADIEGIDKYQLTNIPIVAAGVVHSQNGPVMAILPQWAYVGCSAGQLER
jgi:hypothetical protein